MIAVVLREPGAGAPRVLVRTVRPNATPAAHRALLAALWAARRARARRIVVGVDDPGVVAQVAGQAEVPPGAVVAVLQLRALLNAFDDARLQWVRPQENDAVFAASAARTTRTPVYCDLPLWAVS